MDNFIMLRHCDVPLLIQVNPKVDKRIVDLNLIPINTSIEAGLQPLFLGGRLRNPPSKSRQI
jgi:hypothetical protein